MKHKVYYVDIDGTICTKTENNNYADAKPYKWRISIINQLYDDGIEIHYWTARGMSSGKNWQELTKKQLAEWGCKYTSLNFNKPSYDLWIDDKCMSEREFFGVDLDDF